MGSERWTTASRSRFGRTTQALVEAAKDDVRLFAIFLDDYHIDSHPTITIPLRKALEGFVEQLQPTDIVVLMDPLTTLDSLRYTRNKQQLLERIQKFEGRRGELFPVRSAVEEMQLTQRNVWELRAGVSLSALKRSSRTSGASAKGASPCSSSARDRRWVCRQRQLPAAGSGPAGRQPRQRHDPHPRSAPARLGPLRRRRGAAAAVRGDRRPRDHQHQQPGSRSEGRHRGRERVLPGRLRARRASWPTASSTRSTSG